MNGHAKRDLVINVHGKLNKATIPSHRCDLRYNTSEIIVMDQVQKYMDGPRLLRMRLSEYIPQLSTRNVDLVP